MIGCASHKPEVKQPQIIKKIEQVSLPGWVFHLPPAGNYVIGIAARSFYEDQMKDAAKQMAAIIHSRNKASYAISKKASTTTDDYLRDGVAAFQLNVSSPDETWKTYGNLQLVDEVFFHEFYLALFAEDTFAIDESYKDQILVITPSWYENEGLIVEEQTVKYHILESSSDLIAAWGRATEKARLQIAEYLQKNVQGRVLSENEQITKDVAIESRQKLKDLQISRSFISSELTDNLRSYKVYLEIKTR